MKYEFAPMEGITGWPLRKAHAALFPGVDRYYTPFIAANSTHSLKTREKKEIDPLHNESVALVPQILTNDFDAFLWTAQRLKGIGYETVDLNLGCPSPTVVTHCKGAGFLGYPDRLDAFFEKIFSEKERAPELYPAVFTVKTRLGMNEESETEGLIRIFNRYPIDRIIVHPRLRTDYYKGVPRMELFRLFAETCRHKLTFNGNLMSVADVRELSEQYPELDTVMIGRGLLMDPALVRECRGGAELTKTELRNYHDLIAELWMEDMGDFNHVLGKMKELWFYMGPQFCDADRLLKKLKKARREPEYRAAAAALFEQCDLLPVSERRWRP